MNSRTVLLLTVLAGCGGKPDPSAAATSGQVAKTTEASPITPSTPSTPTTPSTTPTPAASGSAPTPPSPVIPVQVAGAFTLPRGAGELPADNDELVRTFLIVARDGSYRVGAWPATATELSAAPTVGKDVLRSALRAARSTSHAPLVRDTPSSDTGESYGVRIVVVAKRGSDQGWRGENVLLLADAKAPALRVLDAVSKLPRNEDHPGVVPRLYLAVDSGQGTGARSAFRLEQEVVGVEGSVIIDIYGDAVWLGVVEHPIALTASGGIDARAFAAEYQRVYGQRRSEDPTIWLRPDAPVGLLLGVLDGLAAANVGDVVIQLPP